MTKLIKTKVLAALLAGFSAPSMADIAFGLGYQEGDKLSSQYVDLMFRGDIFEIGGEYQHRKRDDMLEDINEDAISDGMAFVKVGAGYNFPLKRITVRPYYNFGIGGAQLSDKADDAANPDATYFNALGVSTKWKFAELKMEWRNYQVDSGEVNGEPLKFDIDEDTFNVSIGMAF
ncbi:hypothetical protein [Vibrio coralliirubri]|uniref:hypothetical protein n=1 Tax=Vibrio coralliirubri TaxID=1516159 RepID=UPI000B34F3D2|nr:hypothetical protein [Vibrio coralliirubri]